MSGQRLNFGSPDEPEYVGTLANGNPWEVLHKIRFGNPGTPMPSAVANGWSIQDVVDVLGYAQTLPIE
jgi:thiosulfate dehydrogenase